MIAFQHELDVTDHCRFCGASRMALDDNRASSNCDIIRHAQRPSNIIPLVLGIFVVLYFGYGIFATLGA